MGMRCRRRTGKKYWARNRR